MILGSEYNDIHDHILLSDGTGSLQNFNYDPMNLPEAREHDHRSGQS
jgi:hypothetical protein